MTHADADISLIRFSTRIIVQIVTGHQIVSFDDPYLHFSHMNNEAFAETGPPGGTPIDFFPFRESVSKSTLFFCMTIFSLQFSTSQIGFRDRIMLRSRENGDL
jgi:hypothetical protein